MTHVAPTVAVWDRTQRVLHALLAAGVALGWATTAWFVGWHRAVGYAAATVVAIRIVWGVVGPRHARFASFVPGPRTALRHAALTVSAREPRYLGHNPLGACMVIALLACVLGLALTGWLYTTDRYWGDETVERIHRALAWAVVGLAVLHVGGVAHTGRRHRENLFRSMLDGKKRAPADGDIA